MDCKVCGSAETPVVFKISQSRVIVRRCRSCGFTFVDYHAEEDDLGTSDHDLAGVPDSLPQTAVKWRGRLELFEAKCGPIRGLRILDAGAGGGGWLKLAREAGAEVQGIEFCAICRGFARTRYGIELDTHAVEDPFWQKQAQGFDLVTAWDVLEHVNDPLGFLRNCLHLLRPGGKLALSTPVRDTFFDAFGETAYALTRGRAEFVLRQRYSHGHLQIFHSRQLRKILRDEGLKEIHFCKIQELSCPAENYFRNVYGEGSFLKPLGAFVRVASRVAPLANKIVCIFERPAVR
jgi:2-polyprenyl-3-methyl-5-hydroxy-6-metoxy-1,4-benzoquinol methylase